LTSLFFCIQSYAQSGAYDLVKHPNNWWQAIKNSSEEFAQSLYNDLKKDSARLSYFINLKLWRSKKLDSLNIVMNPSAIQESIPETYYYSCVLVRPDLPFKPNDVTIQQLRNSGTLRYFSISLCND
jgi:hypothetical protein